MPIGTDCTTTSSQAHGSLIVWPSQTKTKKPFLRLEKLAATKL